MLHGAGHAVLHASRRPLLKPFPTEARAAARYTDLFYSDSTSLFSCALARSHPGSFVLERAIPRSSLGTPAAAEMNRHTEFARGGVLFAALPRGL